MTRRRRAQGGFTLVELMVSLVISSVLVLFMLAVFARLSQAFREHQAVARLQQVLTAVRGALEIDARQVGLAIPQGFTLAFDGGAARHPPVRIVNSAVGPDELAFRYADPEVQAIVLDAPPPTAVTLAVDDATGFAVGDLVVLATPELVPQPGAPPEAPAIAVFTSCVVRLEGIAGNQLAFSTASPWGDAGNAHCAAPLPRLTTAYKFIAHQWRIDPTRPELGALQLDRGGELVGAPAWEDQAYGVTDLQMATYFFDQDGLDTPDPDADPDRDWYASDDQTTLTAPVPVAASFVPPLMASISVVARTPTDSQGVGTPATPRLLDPLNIANNTLGDRDAVALPSATDPMLGGVRIYRHATFQVDFRNLGVGR